jgi:predicted metal-dependent TIM-barrel fold hydrolase
MFNKINPESVENWKYLINITAATGDAVDEGIMLRKVMLTIDLLSKVVEVADCALEDKIDSESKVYYEQLKKNAQQAIKLLAHPPVEFGI